MEIIGTLKRISEVKQVSEKFKKREFVIETKEQYAQTVQFQLSQDRCSIIDGYGPGDELKVHFNLRGCEYTNDKNETNVFNTLDCWKIEGKKGYNNPQAAKADQPFQQ